jgi:S1-C subfamily serine protease
LQESADLLVAVPLHVTLPDASDLPFLEVAATSGACLVTGNTRHFPESARKATCSPASPHGVSVLSPADALHRLAAAGVRVPRPYNFLDGVLLMELVVDGNGNAAPRLNDLELTPELAESFRLGKVQGVLISGVVRGGPADQAGIHAGDILTTVDNKLLADSSAMLETISGLQPGKIVALKLLRNQREIVVQVKVGKRPRTKTQQ